MAISVPSTSARIYAFPQKAARPPSGQRRGGKIIDFQRAPPVVFIEAGSSWYHEAALRESSPGSH